LLLIILLMFCAGWLLGAPSSLLLGRSRLKGSAVAACVGAMVVALSAVGVWFLRDPLGVLGLVLGFTTDVQCEVGWRRVGATRGGQDRHGGTAAPVRR
jgi:hypothetical protein